MAPEQHAPLQPWPIVANVGGPVDPNDHIGHEAELGLALRATEAVGALFLGDRRMGKTSLLRKLIEQLSNEHIVIFLSAETDSPELFGDRLLAELRGHHVFAEEIKRWKVTVDVSYKGICIKRNAESEGEPSGTDDFFAWAASYAGAAKLVLVIDEIAVLVAGIEQTTPGGGAEFLRSLRRPRQERSDVVVMLAGSIGLHHVVPDSAPVNDLQRIYIGPLETDDAVFLARCLILGEEVSVTDEMAVAQAIAQQSEGVAYYVHGLVQRASRLGRAVAPEDIARLRNDAITDPDDPWNLKHYRDRIPKYYGIDAPLVFRLIDMFAITDNPLGIDELRERLLMDPELEAQPSRDRVVDLVERLEADHYLRRSDGRDQIALKILKDAWRHIRRL